MTYIPIRFGMSNAGNTSGTSGTVSHQLVLAGGNNVTLSQSTNAGSATISISAGAGGGGGYTAGMSNLGNTSGTTGPVQSQLVLAGGDNITLSQSVNGQSATLTISGGAGGAAGSNTFGVSNLGNTSGTSGTINGSAAQVVFAGGNNVTLSQSLNGSSATITISAGAGGGGGAQTLSRYQNMDRGTSATLAVPVGSLMMQRLNQENDLFAGNITVSTWLMNMSGTASSGASSTQTLAAHSTTVRIGIYSPVATANTVLTLLNSASTTFGTNTTMSAFPFYFGNRWLSIQSSQWSSSPVFTQGGDYVFAVLVNTSSNSTGLSYLGQNYMNSNQRSGYWGVSSTTGNTTMPHGNYWNAVYSATTNAMPSAISGGQVNRNNATAIFIPHIIMNNQYTY